MLENSEKNEVLENTSKTKTKKFDKNVVFESYSIPKAVATLAIPTVLSMLVTVIYNMADTFFVGQTGDRNQVTAISLTTPVFMLCMAFGNIFGMGGSALISRMLGQGRKDEVKKVSSFCFFGSFTMGIVLSIILLAGMPFILNLLDCNVQTYDIAKDYLTYIAYGCVFVVVSNAFSNVVRGEGAARQAMIGMMIGTVTNIILDPIFIITFGLNAKGAAIATIIGNIFATIYFMIYLCGKKTILSISPKYFTMRNHIFTGVVSIGVPVCITNILMSTSNIILNNYIGLCAGDEKNIAIAAMGVAMKANTLVIMLQLGLAMGVQPLMGYSYGAKNITKLKKVMRFSMLCTVIIGSVITFIYVMFSNQVIRFFIEDSAVVEYGEMMLRALMISSPFIGVMFVFNFTFQGMGKALPALILSISRQGFVFLPVIIIASKLIGLNGIIFAQPIADLGSLFIAWIMFTIVIHMDKKKNTDIEEKVTEF